MGSTQLRPHHLLCERFLTVELSDRGAAYQEAEEKVKSIIGADDDTLLEAAEGVDDLCRACPDIREDRCENANGNEEAVRKWDNIILGELGVPYGETKTSREWRILIEEKAPLKFCKTRCSYNTICKVFDIG